MIKYRIRKYKINPEFKNLFMSLVPGKKTLEYFLLTQLVCLMAVIAGGLYGFPLLLSYFTGIILSAVLGALGVVLFYLLKEENESI